MFHKTEEKQAYSYVEQGELERYLVGQWQQLDIVRQLFPLQGATLVMALHQELLRVIPVSITESFGVQYQTCVGPHTVARKIAEYSSISSPRFHNIILLGLFSTQRYDSELTTLYALKSLQFITKNIITVDVNWFALRVDAVYWSKKFDTFGPDESLRKYFSWDTLHALHYDPTFMSKVLPRKQKISEQIEIDHLLRTNYLQGLLGMYQNIVGPGALKIELAKHQVVNCASAIRRAPPVLVNLFTTPAP
jgi:hypothetical protein